MRSRIWMLAAMAALMGDVAAAETFRFSGTTTVDMTTARDALKQIQLVGLGKLNCGVISEVEAEVLPANYKPAETENYAAGSKEIYERWTVSLCGQRVPFLLGFWPAKQGGTMFHVRHPFPADANATR